MNPQLANGLQTCVAARFIAPWLDLPFHAQGTMMNGHNQGHFYHL
jgi:hypothetical protein